MNAPQSDEAVRARLFAIVSRQAKIDVDLLRPEATLKELGIASLEAIELFFDIEEDFNITFPDEHVNFDTNTVQNLIDAVRAALLAKFGDAKANT